MRENYSYRRVQEIKMFEKLKGIIVYVLAYRGMLKELEFRRKNCIEIKTALDGLAEVLSSITDSEVKDKLEEDIKELKELSYFNDNRMNRLRQITEACKTHDMQRVGVLLEPYAFEDDRFIKSVPVKMQSILDHLAQLGEETVDENGVRVVKVSIPTETGVQTAMIGKED